MTKTIVLIALLLPAAALAGCGLSQEQLDMHATQVVGAVFATETAAAALAATGTTPPAPQPTALATEPPTAQAFRSAPTSMLSNVSAGRSPLAVDQIYTSLAPMIAYVETKTSSGSGVLIHDGYLVTNAHVVWPFDRVRVVFPDGAEFLEAPVVDWDLVADLAVVGPLTTTLAGVTLADGENLPIGSPVYLLGYPGLAEKYPQPAITGGLISRRREWPLAGMTYIQTDADIIGGQSGGILASQNGEVIGISGFGWPYPEDLEVQAWIASARDDLPRIEGMIAGRDVDGLGQRRLPLKREPAPAPASSGLPWKARTRLENRWDTRTYVLNEPVGTAVTIEAEGANNLYFCFLSAVGPGECVDNTTTGVETGVFTTTIDAPHLIVLHQTTNGGGATEVRSDHTLVAYRDIDDGGVIAKGQTLRAAIDHPDDWDYFVIVLREGEMIDISIDSLNVNPQLVVGFLGATSGEIAFDKNGGGGAWQTNSQLTYQAPRDGRYVIVVGSDGRQGGYFLQVSDPKPDATPEILRTPTPTPTPAQSIVLQNFGPMTQYTALLIPASFRYPAEWAPMDVLGATAAFAGESGSSLVIAEDDLLLHGLGKMSLSAYVDLALSSLQESMGKLLLLGRYSFTTKQGLPAEIIVYTGPGSQVVTSQLVYVHQDRYAFSAAYTLPRTIQRQLQPMVDYSFYSFELTARPTETPAASRP